ncbi:MAG: sensor histidine kinase, partial [Elusimicrobia bacterium]|nr:sensor histidine kinase [Elusimicrobiota bacterium]
MADPAHLHQVLQNLLDNAIKYNRKGGSVRIHGRRLPDGFALVSISDTGIGIYEEDLPLLFQQFH